MKTLLFPTDFSANATHAAEYGYSLARQMQANVLLCNAIIIPAEVPQAGMVAWPMEEYDVLMDDSNLELKHLKKHLENDDAAGFKPAISFIAEPGIVTEVVNGIIASQKVDLVVIGTHNSDGLSTFLLGNHSRNLINNPTKMLLLVPPTAKIKPVKKIAFATDFQHPKEDLEAVYELIALAKPLNAEILITHVYNEDFLSHKFQNWINGFLTELSNKADYPHIYHRFIKNKHPEAGLDWLCENGQVDMLAMVHRPHDVIDTIIKGSHTQKMANHISIPLLVFAEK